MRILHLHSFRLFRPTFGLLVAVASLAATSMHGADYVTTVESTPGLLGYWRYTGATGANSYVGGYTGTFKGNAALSAAGSAPALADDPSGRSVALDGSSGTFVNTSLIGGINQAGSIVGWFKLSALPSAVGRVFYIAGESQGGNDFDLQIETDNTLRFYTNGGGAVVNPTAFTMSDVNQWVFFAATFTSGGNATIYVNGAQVVQGSAGGHGNGTGTFSMGDSDVFSGRFFQGGLDEIALYDTELSASQVAAIYNSRNVVMPGFFNGQAAVGNSAYYLSFSSTDYFGYYSFLSDPHYIYHFDLGYEYVFDANDGKNGVYLYDFASKTFFYTSPAFPFPYLYDFSLNTVLYYYPDPNNAGHYNTNGTRYFYRFDNGQIITK